MKPYKSVIGSVFGVCLLAFAVVAEDPPTKGDMWTFDSDKAGGLAKGFARFAGEWQVFADEGAPSGGNVLAQIAKSGHKAFNLVLVDGSEAKDVDVSVKFKAMAGEDDQGGGPVWRAQDAKNYYVARFNPLEDNFRVYKVHKGERTKLASRGIKHAEGWHTIRVTMTGKHIECYYDGKKRMELDDETFGEAGRIGLWTKADAVTYFDDLTLTGR